MDAAPRLRAVPSSPGGLSFHVLGRLEAHYDGVELDLGPRKQRAVLALLLLNANRVVSLERLIDDLWANGCYRPVPLYDIDLAAACKK